MIDIIILCLHVGRCEGELDGQVDGESEGCRVGPEEGATQNKYGLIQARIFVDISTFS